MVISMAENFFHYPDEIIFHANPTNGVTFKEIRALNTDQDKLLSLQKRLTDYYINGLKSISHSFMMAIITCVGIEVLGQMTLGFEPNGDSIAAYTLNIYEMLDEKLKLPLSSKFKTAYASNTGRDILSMNGFSNYAGVLRKGLRNAFTHNYRSLGVFLGGDELLSVYEDDGLIIVNHEMFKHRFINCFESCFEQILSNTNPAYRQQALKYFELLIK
jgi:hypothetical protein